MNAMLDNPDSPVRDEPVVPLRFTRYTAAAGLLTKMFRRDQNGHLDKKTFATLYDGTAETIEVADIVAFRDHVLDLATNQAIGFGITDRPAGRVVRVTTKDALKPGVDAIARTEGTVLYPRGPGIFQIDVDLDHLREPIPDGEALRNVILGAVPEFEAAPMLWLPSASSFISDSATGEQLTGLRGQRLYIAVADASDIPRVSKIIYERLWIAGHGSYAISCAGHKLDRNVADRAVWRASGLDFAAGAEAVAPLVQRRGKGVLWNERAVPVDTRSIAELDASERAALASARATAKAEVEDDARLVREIYIAVHAEVLSKERGIDLESATNIIRQAVTGQRLLADFVLYPEHGEPVTVGQVLDDPKRWHGCHFSDPIEPQYRGDRRIARANLFSGGAPFLWSHAHGGRKFELLRQPSTIEAAAGQRPRMVDQALDIIRLRGELFDLAADDGTARDNVMVRLAGEGLVPIDPVWLGDYLGRHIHWLHFSGKAGLVPVDTPQPVCTTILAKAGERALPKLVGVISAPILRLDGTVLDVPGYDIATNLLYVTNEPSPPRVPMLPTLGQVQEAVAKLWRPFALFPYENRVARGVALAGVLTAVLRPVLPTAPGLMFDAPAFGTGKTLLAKAIGALLGYPTAPTALPDREEEVEKRVFTRLLKGARDIFFDNIKGKLNSPALDALMTSRNYTGRILGKSQDVTVPNRALVLMTSNNAQIERDMVGRMLTCRINARVEVPYQRTFPFDPEQYVLANRLELVTAALTLVRGYLTRRADFEAAKALGAYDGGAVPLGRFEDWDRLVRQVVCWCDAWRLLDVGDPFEVMRQNQEADTHRDQLRGLLEAWYGCFGSEPVTAKTVMDRANRLSFSMLVDGGRRTAEEAARDTELADAIEAISGGARDFDALRLSGYLRQHREQLAGGLWFEKAGEDKHGKVARWCVKGTPPWAV